RATTRRPRFITSCLEEMEIGAGWLRENKQGGEYTLVKLDCPLFQQPVFCVLIKDPSRGLCPRMESARQPQGQENR
ncbi:MAG: DUF736 family protein, partial [Candidatus Acidiferrales bacterium]